MHYFVSAIINPTGSPSYIDNTIVSADSHDQADETARQILYPKRPQLVSTLSICELDNITTKHIGVGYFFADGSETVYLVPTRLQMKIGSGFCYDVSLYPPLDWSDVISSLTSQLCQRLKVDSVVVVTINPFTD